MEVHPAGPADRSGVTGRCRRVFGSAGVTSRGVSFIPSACPG